MPCKSSEQSREDPEHILPTKYDKISDQSKLGLGFLPWWCHVPETLLCTLTGTIKLRIMTLALLVCGAFSKGCLEGSFHLTLPFLAVPLRGFCMAELQSTS